MAALNTKNAVTAYTKISASASVVDLVAENGNRVGLMIFNDAAANLFIRIDANATLTDYNLKIPAYTLYEMPYEYFTDKVTGIWDAATGTAKVTEIKDR